MKLLTCIGLLATSVALFGPLAKALYIPTPFDIVPDLAHAVKHHGQQSHQTHYDFVEVLPVDHKQQRKQQHPYEIEEEDDHSWLSVDAILEAVLGKAMDQEKDLHAQRVQQIKEPTSRNKDAHHSHNKEKLDDLAEILEADGVNIGVMIIS